MKQEFWYTTTLHIKLVALVSSLFHKKVQMRDLKHPDIGIFGSCGINQKSYNNINQKSYNNTFDMKY